MITQKDQNLLTVSEFSSSITYNMYNPSEMMELKDIIAEHTGNVVIDLEGVEHIDSICIGQFVNIISRFSKTNAQLSIINVEKSVAKLFSLLMLDRIIKYSCK